jgi:hypothetical protein
MDELIRLTYYSGRIDHSKICSWINIPKKFHQTDYKCYFTSDTPRGASFYIEYNNLIYKVSYYEWMKAKNFPEPHIKDVAPPKVNLEENPILKYLIKKTEELEDEIEYLRGQINEL